MVVHVLGPLGVVVDGFDVVLSSRRQRALLAALAVRDRPVPVADLLDAVWDDDPPDGARTTLQTYVSRIRRVIGRTAVVHGPAGYQLGVEVGTDVGSVRSGLAAVRRVAADDHERRAELATELLGRWHGPALAEFGEADWFRGVRVELDETWANLVDIAAEALIALGRASEAVALLETGIDRAPWREPTHILLVRALHAAGRTTDAVRAAASYRKRLGEETGLVPGREFDGVESEVLNGEAPAVIDTAPSGSEGWASTPLPRATPLVGRSGELRAIRTAMEHSRLVTVAGPGGIGKTRLVAELLRERDAAHAGVPSDQVVVELAPVGAGSVPAAVAAAFGVRSEHPTAGVVAERLHGVRALLVLDNAEHVISEVRELCRLIRDRCDEITIVVTSRERLDLGDEIVVTVDPLPTGGAKSDAARLFLDRLRRADPRYDVDDTDPRIESLCIHLDGVPLALELAASRAAVLGIADLERLLGASAAGLADVDGLRGRHGTLGNVVEWSVGLLGEPGQRLLAALSVFRGEFDLDAAVAVGSVVLAEPVAVVLGRLVDTSLVRRGSTAGTYGMLDMVRQFAARRLSQLERVAEVRRAHAAWVARRMSAIDEAVPGPDEAHVVARLDASRHEVRTAVRWSLESGDVASAAAIAVALAGPLLYRPDVDLLNEVRLVSEQPALRGADGEAASLAAGARAAFLLGDLDSVADLATQSLDLSGADDASTNRARHALGVLALYQGRFDDALSWFDAEFEHPAASLTDRLDALGGTALAKCYLGQLAGALEAIELLGGLLAARPSATYGAFGDYVRGEVHLAAGEIDDAAAWLSTAADRAWEAGAGFVWGVASTVLAAVLVRHRPPAEARAHLPTLVARWRRSATWPQLWTTLRLVAIHLAETGQPAVARLILEAADRDPSAPTLTGEDVEHFAALRTALDAELGAVADGTVAAARVVDRTIVLDRAMDALRTAIA